MSRSMRVNSYSVLKRLECACLIQSMHSSTVPKGLASCHASSFCCCHVINELEFLSSNYNNTHTQCTFWNFIFRWWWKWCFAYLTLHSLSQTHSSQNYKEKIKEDWLTHSLTSGPPVLSCKTLIISFPLTNGFTSHTFSRPAFQEINRV